MRQTNRRVDDNGETDYKALRRHSEKTLSSWVTGAFAGAVIAALGFLLVADRDRIGKDAGNALKTATANTTAVAVVQVELSQIKKTLDRLEVTQREILEAVK